MAVIDSRELEKGIEKITMYESEGELYLDDLKTNLIELTNLYKTGNTNKLSSLSNDLKEKFNKTNIIHNNYINILNKTIKKYQNTSAIAADKFSKIDTDLMWGD